MSRRCRNCGVDDDAPCLCIRASAERSAPTPPPTTSRERFGAGVCATGVCVEPCGRDGGCSR